ncbi:MAG: FecR family protein [bacterium]|nr:FecR family protein [bacterium]
MQKRSNVTKHASRTGTIVLVLLALVLSGGTAMADAVARQVSGAVEIGSGEPPMWRALSEGDTLAPNERIRTGADGRVEIVMDAGTLRVHENSMLRLPPPTSAADRVDLERGNSLFDVLRRGGRRFEVHTPTVVVSVKGTRFGVDASDGIGQVAVYHGVVGVREVGADAAIETLVREGFLATGGIGRMIELDVAPGGDPWVSWQDFRREVDERPAAPAARSDVDRARGLMHRATNEDVIRRAAERKPEVAERLRRLQQERANGARAKGLDAGAAGDGSMKPVPAAPMLPEAGDRGDERKRKMMREMLPGDTMQDAMRDKQRDAVQQRLQNEAIMEAMMRATDPSTGDPLLGGLPLVNGDTAMTPEAVQALQGQVLLDVLQARDTVWGDFFDATGGTTPWTPGEFRDAMEQALIDRGYDGGAASAIVNQLDGN